MCLILVVVSGSGFSGAAPVGCITRPRGGLRSFFARSVKVLQPILISPTEPLRQPGDPAANALVHRISEPTVRYDDEQWARAQGGLALPRSVLAAGAPGWARHMSCRRRFGVLQTAYRSSRVERAAAGRRCRHAHARHDAQQCPRRVHGDALCWCAQARHRVTLVEDYSQTTARRYSAALEHCAPALRPGHPR